MGERNIVLLSGIPGSGKSRLGKNLVERLKANLAIEHLSTGDLVRAIGSRAVHSAFSDEVIDHLNSERALAPLPDKVMYGILREYLPRLDADQPVDTLLLDGYPRSVNQVDDIYEIAEGNQRDVIGMLQTTVDEETAVSRQVRREQRAGSPVIDEATALWRIETQKMSLRPVTDTLRSRSLPVEWIDSSADQATTTALALRAIASMLRRATGSNQEAAS